MAKKKWDGGAAEFEEGIPAPPAAVEAGLADPVPSAPVDAHLRLRVRALAREIIDQAEAGADLGAIQRLARHIEHAVDTA